MCTYNPYGSIHITLVDPHLHTRCLLFSPTHSSRMDCMGLGFKATFGFASGINGRVGYLISYPYAWLFHTD